MPALPVSAHAVLLRKPSCASTEMHCMTSAGIAKFDERTAHLLMAAADYVIIPSRFEPCGLVAQSAARYGAVPIVTAVGGLKDFVTSEVSHHWLKSSLIVEGDFPDPAAVDATWEQEKSLPIEVVTDTYLMFIC